MKGHRRSRDFTGFLTASPAVVIGLICCAMPLIWMLAAIVANPEVRTELRMSQFRAMLLARTLGYNGTAAVIATLMGLPAGLVLGRGRGWLAKLLWVVLPAALLMPSLSYAYGWSQFVRLSRGFFRPMGITFIPGGTADVFRCIWSLAAWLWAVPAGLIGLSLRRLDPNIQQQAALEGALYRVTFRQLAGPIIASLAVVTVLATQEFAVYEPTGISVVATEVRMVFDTGAMSSPDNSIAGTVSQGAGAKSPEQPARAAAAVATDLPLLGITIVLSLLAIWGASRASAADAVAVGTWPKVLDAPLWAAIVSGILVLLNIGLPVWALVAALREPFSVPYMWKEFGPQVQGAMFVALIATGVAALAAFSASGKWTSGLIALAGASFLVGGQLLAIALIRIYNRPWLDWAYNAYPVPVIAYVGRFGWLSLAAGRGTWTAPWRELRDMASIDGANTFRTARSVIWPLAWPTLTAGALLVGALSLTEVPATVLLFPQRPQVLTPMLMTWVHMARFDPMIEASLLMMISVLVPAILALGLVWVASHGRWKLIAGKSTAAIFAIFLLVLPGCSRSAAPDQIWCETGTGPGQVVYPRGLAHDSIHDTTFVVDRMARIQQFDTKGNCLTSFRMPEWKSGKPVGLTIGPDGNVYVPDTHYQRVIVFTPDGKEIRRWGSFGHDDGQFVYPTDVEFDSKGRLFVSEYGDNDRIQVFAPDGKFLYKFGHFGQGNGEFSRPQDMVIVNDTIYLTDACNHRIDVFKTDGTWVRNMGSCGDALGQFRFPYGMDIDKQGHLIVAEFGNNRIQMIDKDTGQGLKTWGSNGRDPGQLAYPWGVIVDNKNRIVAVDAGNNRLQVFEF